MRSHGVSDLCFDSCESFFFAASFISLKEASALLPGRGKAQAEGGPHLIFVKS